MPRITETKAFADALSSIEPHSHDFKATVRTVRGDIASFDNLVDCAAHEIVSMEMGRQNGALSTFVSKKDFASGQMSPMMINSMFHDLLHENRDLFWLESVPGGGFYCHTPKGLFILGASTFVAQNELVDARLAILSSGLAISAKAPRLISFEREAMIRGGRFPFYDEVETDDFSFIFKRVNDYEIEAVSDGRSWGISLLDQFMDTVRDLDEADIYLDAWKDLSMFINMHIEINRRKLTNKSKELEGRVAESSPHVDWLINSFSHLKLITRAIKGFRLNRLVKESWEGAFVAAQIDVLTDNFAWLDVVPTEGGGGDRGTLSRLFDMKEATRAFSEIFCPVSYLTALAKVAQLKRYAEIEMKAKVEKPIEIEKAADTRQLIDSAIDLIGRSPRFDKQVEDTSHQYEPARIEVEWEAKGRRLKFVDRTKGHSGFAALDPDSKGRNHLDRLAKRAGAKVDYLIGAIAITLPEASSPEGGGVSGGGGTLDERSIGQRGSFNEMGIPKTRETVGGAQQMTAGGFMMLNAVQPLQILRPAFLSH